MKKAIKIALTSVILLAASAGLSFGIMKLIQMKNVAETGNVLGISWYDPTAKEFTINTLEELEEFAQLSDFYDFKGQKIKLGADIVINEGNAEDWKEQRPEGRWEPIQKFAGTFDGQDHTISGLYAKASDSNMALFVDPKYECTIKNLRLVNSFFETSGFQGTASFVSGGGGNFSGLYSDAIFEHKGENVGGIFSSLTKQSVISECWFDGKIHLTLRDAGGIVDTINKAYVTMDHCLFSGTIISDNTLNYSNVVSRVGGICGSLENEGTLLLKDSLACGTIQVEDTAHAGGMLGMGSAKTQIGVHDTYVSMDTHSSVVGPSGASSAFTGNALLLPGNKLKGVTAYQWTTLDFENYWVAVEDGTPQLKRFAEESLSLEGVKKAFDISWYQKNKRNFTIKTPEQLCGMFILSAHETFQDKSVSLGADIVYNTGNAKDWATTPPANDWMPIQNFSGIFDGKGHTISGLYSNTNTRYQGLFANTRDSAFLKDFSIKNSYFYNTATQFSAVGSAAGESYGNISGVYSDAIIVVHADQVGGIVGRANDPDWDGTGDDAVEISNCWFDGSIELNGETTMNGGGIVGIQVQGDLALSHCLNTGTVTSEAINRTLCIGGFVGRANHPKTLTIIDSLTTGKITEEKITWQYGIGSAIGRMTEKEMVGIFQNTYTTVEAYEKYIIGIPSPSTIKGGITQMKEEMYIGANAYKYTDLDFDKYWALRKDGTPVLKSFQEGNLSTKGVKKAIDNSWYNDTDKEFVLKTPEQLLGFALKAAGNTFEGKTIKLGADIDMSSAEKWFSIGSRSNYFAGTFDGQGHTISGINQVLDTDNGGLFGGVSQKGTLKNFRLENSTFTYNDPDPSTVEVHIWLGSVCGELRGTMENVYSSAVLNTNRSRVGGLIGVANSLNLAEGRPIVSINNCWFDGEINATGKETRRLGGIVSVVMQGDVRITNCLNTGSISAETTPGASFAGGIVGTNSADDTQILISNCVNTGLVSSTEKYFGMGAIVGLTGGGKKTVYTIENSYALNTSCVNEKGVTVLKNIYLGSYAGEDPVSLTKAELEGSAAYYATELDFNKYWAMKDKEFPVLKSFVSASGLINTASLTQKDTSWYNKNATELHIRDEEDFYGMMALSMEGTTFEDQIIYLDADLKLNEVATDTIAKWKAGTETPKNIWFAIGSQKTPFRGVFDGNGHTISGVYLKTGNTGAGLFGYTQDAIVKNFKLVDSYFESTAPVSAGIGSVIGYGKGALLNVYSNATVYTSAIGAGGLAAEAADMRIDGCWYDGDISMVIAGASGGYYGGLVGVSREAIIQNCLFSGNLSLDFTASDVNQSTYGARTGGICGGDSGKAITITNVINAGKMNMVWHHNDETGATTPNTIVWLDGILGGMPSAEADYKKRVYSAVEGTTYIEDKNATSPIGGNIAIDKLLGTKGFTNTLLDFEEAWAARDGKVPAPKRLVAEADRLDVTGLLQADVEWFTGDKKEYVITKASELVGLAAIVNGDGNSLQGITIKLGKDIKVNEVTADILAKWAAGTSAPAQIWNPIGSAAVPFMGTFDGQMHTISGFYAATATEGAGLFGVIGDKGIVKNLYLKDSVVRATKGAADGRIGSVAGHSRGIIDTVYSNAIVVSNTEKTGGIVGWISGGTSTVKNCWFDGEIRLDGWYGKLAAGIVGYVGGESYGAIYNITNNLYTGKLTYKSLGSPLMISGIVGGAWAWYRPVINISDCLSAGQIIADGTTSVAGVGAIAGYIENLGTGYIPTLNVENIYGTSECASVLVNIKSGTILNGLSGTGTSIAKAELYGYKGYQKTLLDFEDTWVVRTDNVPALKVFDKVIDDAKVIKDFTGYEQNQWYNANVTAYGIHSASALKAVSTYSNTGTNFQGKTIYLSEDIQVNKVEEGTLAAWKAGTGTLPTSWEPIGFASAFQGTLDGRMYTIRGVYMKRNATCTSYQGGHGLVGQIGYYGTVKNISLKDSYLEVSDPRGNDNSGTWYNANLGSVVGNNGGKVQNIYSNAIVVANRYQVGGIIGYTGGRGVSNCWFDGEIELKTAHGRTAGGIVGIAGNLETLENLLFTGKISYQNAYYVACNIGGILGSTYNQWSHTITIKNAISAGTLVKTTQTGQVGSVVGVVVTKNGLKLENVYATSDFFATPYTINSGATLTGSATTLTEAKLYGNLAKTNAAALDYTNTWVVREGDVPALKVFVK